MSTELGKVKLSTTISNNNGRIQQNTQLQANNTNSYQIKRKFYSNGKVHFEDSFKDGVRNGIGKEFYEDGNIKSKCNFIRGKVEGIYTVYYESRKMKSERNMVNGYPNGIFKTYFEDGSLQYQATYKMGKKNGPFILYNSPGILAETGNDKNDQFDGEIKDYYPTTGELKGVVIFKEGVIVNAHVAEKLGI